jgi:hypothetical protein
MLVRNTAIHLSVRDNSHSPRRTEFYHRAVKVGFVVEKLAAGEINPLSTSGFPLRYKSTNLSYSHTWFVYIPSTPYKLRKRGAVK